MAASRSRRAGKDGRARKEEMAWRRSSAKIASAAPRMASEIVILENRKSVGSNFYSNLTILTYCI